MNGFTSVIGTAVLLAATNAAAQAPATPAPAVVTPAPSAPPAPARMMRDQTRAEAQQRADAMFQMLDANKDGAVTKAEADAAVAQFSAAREEAGGHGAGRIQRMVDEAFGTAQSLTIKQFEAKILARFDASDLNHDGTLTAAERQQARALGNADKPAQ